LQGWDDPRLLAILAGELDHNLDREIEQLKTVFCELGYVRLNVLESQDRFEEYLCFAEILGFLVPYVTMLIQLERLEQAIESAEKLENHEQAFAIAQKFLEHGSEQEALRTAHKGLQLLEGVSSANYATELAVWTAALAEQLGETKILLNAKIIAFKFKPSLADYHEIRDLTGDKWNSTNLCAITIAVCG
jgi:acyl-CoA synthetase (NDP forming)